MALIGASGFVGSPILEELLNCSYKVEALVLNPDKIRITNHDFFVKNSLLLISKPWLTL